MDEKETKQHDESLLIELVKGVAVLTSKFDTFEKDRSEDNVALKESIEKVDQKVEKLDSKFDSKFEDMRLKHAESIAAVNTRIDTIERAPIKDKADKWERTVRLVFEGVLTVCLAIILVKIGLK